MSMSGRDQEPLYTYTLNELLESYEPKTNVDALSTTILESNTAVAGLQGFDRYNPHATSADRARHLGNWLGENDSGLTLAAYFVKDYKPFQDKEKWPQPAIRLVVTCTIDRLIERKQNKLFPHLYEQDIQDLRTLRSKVNLPLYPKPFNNKRK